MCSPLLKMTCLLLLFDHYCDSYIFKVRFRVNQRVYICAVKNNYPTLHELKKYKPKFKPLNLQKSNYGIKAILNTIYLLRDLKKQASPPASVAN